MARIFITGATGWVGSVVSAELKSRGHELLFLVRGERGRRRLRELLGSALTGSDAVLEGDVTLSHAGVGPSELAARRSKIDVVLHLAAAVRLDEAGDEELWRVNVEGTRNVLALASALAVPAFCHMSTCAIAGDAAAFSEDDLDVGQGLRNGYERTKLEAERLARTWSGRLMVLRMPGLVGDSRTGRTSFFSGAFYRVMAAYWSLREELLTVWRGGERSALAAEGIVVGEDGSLHLALHVPISAGSACEIVPQDWLAATVAELLGRGHVAGTFHLMHPSPPPAAWVIDTSLAHLGIEPPVPGVAEPAPHGPWARFVRRTLDRMARHHYPYLLHMPRFTCATLRRILGDGYVAPVPIDQAFLARILDYGTAHGFAQ